MPHDFPFPLNHPGQWTPEYPSAGYDKALFGMYTSSVPHLGEDSDLDTRHCPTDVSPKERYAFLGQYRQAVGKTECEELRESRWHRVKKTKFRPRKEDGSVDTDLYTDTVHSGPPSRTISLGYESRTAPHRSRQRMPTLVGSAARVVASNMELYADESFRPSGGLGPGTLRALLRALERGDEPLDIGNWTRFVRDWGETALEALKRPGGGGERGAAAAATGLPARGESSFFADPCPAARPVPTDPAALHRHRTLLYPRRELLHFLTTSPPTSPLLLLNSPAPSGIPFLVSLNLSGTNFSDANASALKILECLVSLDTENTRLTDVGVAALAISVSKPGDERRSGLLRLQSWSVRGCGGVSDRSAKSFKRFPRLCYIDVRRTSCTEPTFKQLLNRSPVARSLSTTSFNNWHSIPPPEGEGFPLLDLLHLCAPPPPNHVSLTISSHIHTFRNPSTFRERGLVHAILVRTASDPASLLLETPEVEFFEAAEPPLRLRSAADSGRSILETQPATVKKRARPSDLVSDILSGVAAPPIGCRPRRLLSPAIQPLTTLSLSSPPAPTPPALRRPRFGAQPSLLPSPSISGRPLLGTPASCKATSTSVRTSSSTPANSPSPDGIAPLLKGRTSIVERPVGDGSLRVGFFRNGK